MKTTFIVTSALITKIGIYDLTSRLQQTHQTLDSIYAKFPDAQVMLVDGGEPGLKTIQHPLLESLKDRVGAFLDLSDDEQIQHLHNIEVGHQREMGGISGLVKSMAEMTIFQQALILINEHENLRPLRDVDRIFKVSGRYQLSPLFDVSAYALATGKYVFKERTPSWIPQAQQIIGTDHCFQSRCWSMDAAQLEHTIDKYNDMMQDLQEHADLNRYIDVEHLLYKHLGTNQTMELEYVHFMGTIAPNGTMIYD
jgi:hypothetical protein